MAGTKWTEHVKAFALEHKISYKQAMKDASASYKSVGKPVEEPAVETPAVEPAVETPAVILPPQIKHKRAPKKVKEAFPLNVGEILKTESEVVKKEKKVKKA